MQGYELLLLWNYVFLICYDRSIHTRFMSKEMTSKEKLLFIVSFIWAMHWGVRVAFAAISTFELRYF